MRILIAGKLNNPYAMERGNSGPGGFTLIELAMVIFLLGMFLSLTVPRLRDAALKDSLKNSSRKLIGYITEVRSMAIRDHIDYYLMLDLDSNQLWIDSTMFEEDERIDYRKSAYTLPEGVEIMDILFRDEDEKTSGETGIRFTREGYIQPSIIHLGSKDGRRFSFALSPFLGRVELLEDYVDFEEMDEKI